MPEYLAPGVYVEEVSFRAKSIEGVGTSTTAFVGPTRRGPLTMTPEVVTSAGEFERVYGGLANLSFTRADDANPPFTSYMAHAVRAFFDNGGSRLYVARVFVPRTNPDGTIASDGVAESAKFVGAALNNRDDQAFFRARMPGSGLNNLQIKAFEKASPASEATMKAASAGTLVRVGGDKLARPASLVGGKPPFIIDDGSALELTLRDGGKEITFQGSNAEVTGEERADPIDIPPDTSLTVTIDGISQTIAIAQADDLPLANLVQLLNSQIRHGYVRLEGGNKLAFGTDKRGKAAEIKVAENETLGFPEDRTDEGDGNVADLEAVTVAEIDQLLQSADIPVKATTSPDTGKLTLSTNETKAEAILRAGGSARVSLGLPEEQVSGQDGNREYYLKRDDKWVSKTNGANPLDPAKVDPSTDHFLAMTLVVTDADGNDITYDDLGFDPAHRRYVGEILRQTPTRKADQLLNPCYIHIGANVGPFDLRDGMFGTQSGNTIVLSGGNDGAEPAGSSTVEGAVAYDAGLLLLEDIEDVAIIAAPGHSALSDVNFRDVRGKLIGHAEKMKYRIAVLDTPEGQIPGQARESRSSIDSSYAALYYPWVVVANPLARPSDDRISKEIALPPSGFMAGVYARTDVQRGVWKPPANEVVRGALRFEREINKATQETLNPDGVNCLRFFPGRGYRIWGARTASSDPEWKYVNVRRYFIYLEHSIDRSTQWAVFEPNGERLWSNIRETITAFLYNEWVSGALLGATAQESFFVRCDRSTMTQNDIDNGRLICLIGVAALKPAEFVIFRIGQKTADARN